MLQPIQDWDGVYDVNTYIQQLPAYNISEGNDSLMDLVRVINESGNYMWVGDAFPNIPVGTLTNLAANATINGTMALPAGTYVISLSFFMSKIGGNDYGIKINLYDKGTKASIFYGNYCQGHLAMSPMRYNMGQTVNNPFGPAYLLSPFIITPPGNLNWEIVNLGASDVLVQVMAQCAVPVNNQSLNTRLIQRSTS